MAKKSVGRVVSEVPSRCILLDFTKPEDPKVEYHGLGWSGTEVRIALNLVKQGYRSWRYNQAHKKEAVK